MKINILLLGPDGVGKTCYIAALNEACWVPKHGRKWFLETPPEQRKAIVELWRDISNPDLDFPRGTVGGQFVTWTFNCKVISASSKKPERFTPISFQFYDYRGDIFSQSGDGSEFTSQFFARVRNADVVMGVFDGGDILDLMSPKNEMNNGAFLARYGAMLMGLQENERGSPVHFMITKWDIIAPKYKLHDVRARLLKFPRFRDFVDSRQGDFSVRLIPISAVGPGFAAREANGEMKKIGPASREATPQYVEIPIAVLLIDVLKVHMKELEREKKITRTLRKLLNSFDRVASRIPNGPLQIVLGVAKVALSVQAAWARKRIKDERTALESVVFDLTVEQRAYDIHFPDSLLVRGR